MTDHEEYDAVVIGSGPNGLVAANLLVDAGWSVLVLEEQDEVGGAVRSAEDVYPGFVHDTFSSFYPLAAASPTVQALGLEKHGLRWSHAPAVVGTPFADGSWALLHPKAEDTAAALDAQAPGDGEAWMRLCGQWERIGPAVLGALVTPFPPVRNGLRAMARLPRVGGLDFVRDLLSPARAFADRTFTGEAPKVLLAGNAAHADIPMDSPGSAMFGWLLCMLGQDVGFPVPEGGAGMLTQAMARRFQAQGGEIRLDSRATGIEVADRVAKAVRTEHGDSIAVRRAVIADVSAPALYGGLVSWENLPARTRRRISAFQWDPGTVKVDWALDGPIPWSEAPAATPGTVHVGETMGEIAVAGSQIASGSVPDKPFLLLGQMAAADPSRAPDGAESVWAYTHVPQQVRSDAGASGNGGQAITGAWDTDDLERMADRMQARVERYAPGFTARVVARRVLGPREMEQRDRNLEGGALNGGTANVHQQLVFRPVPGTGRAETPVRRLYLGSASAHPGGGVHGACGANAAKAALAHERLSRLRGGTSRS
ncbi:MAG: NAD(P)/FAD-dependent oxidoreductase [Nocardioidaceae bacterium]|nr:NAD(P)/FAD-dependent oxidoreductase [Nocardioidaceae bacterium]